VAGAGGQECPEAGGAVPASCDRSGVEPRRDSSPAGQADGKTAPEREGSNPEHLDSHARKKADARRSGSREPADPGYVISAVLGEPLAVLSVQREPDRAAGVLGVGVDL
jgi:hypothetical protein